MSLCPNGHDRDAIPLGSNGGCRLCQRARQTRYRKTPRGRRLNNVQAATEPAKNRKRNYWRTRRVVDPVWAQHDRKKALAYYHAHREERIAYARAFASRAKRTFPHVTDSQAAVAIYRQVMKGVAA